MIEVSLNSGQQVLLKFKNIVSEVVAKYIAIARKTKIPLPCNELQWVIFVYCFDIK